MHTLIRSDEQCWVRERGRTDLEKRQADNAKQKIVHNYIISITAGPECSTGRRNDRRTGKRCHRLLWNARRER